MPPIRSVTKTPSGLVIATNTPLGTVTVDPVPTILTVQQWNAWTIAQIDAAIDAWLAKTFEPYFYARAFVVSKSPVTVQVICQEIEAGPIGDGWFTG